MGCIHKRSPEGRFWSKVEKTDSCWLWQGGTTDRGYGRFHVDARVGSKLVYPHRYIFTLIGREIPEDMQVDHLCHNPACVNPDHLRFVTTKENAENRSGAQKNNKSSGIRGVSWDKNAEKWYVRVTHNGTVHNGGRYDNIKDAETAAIALRNALFTCNELDRTSNVVHINVKTGKKKVLKLKVNLDQVAA